MERDGAAERFRLAMENRRLELGVSLTELALKIGPPCTVGYLSKVSNGKLVPGFDRAMAIVKALGIDMEELRDGN